MEIFAWGREFPAQLARLGITTLPAYPSSEVLMPSIYDLTEAELAILTNDSPQNWHGWDASWTPMDMTITQLPTGEPAVVYGHPIQGHKSGTYPHLWAYLRDNLLMTYPGLIIQRSIDLAVRNGMTVAELYNRYQPIWTRVEHYPMSDGGLGEAQQQARNRAAPLDAAGIPRRIWREAFCLYLEVPREHVNEASRILGAPTTEGKVQTA